jgi:Arc/MetJ-type ribon-helix-helix transcriptional regulator
MEIMKAKMSVTVEQNLVQWIDRQVETQRFRNRSHAVEVALRTFIQNEKKEESPKRRPEKPKIELLRSGKSSI